MTLRELRAGPADVRSDAAAAIGFVVAPVPAAVAFAITTPVGATRFNTDPLALLVMFPVGYCLAFLFTLAVALPLYLLARRLRLANLWSASLAGGTVGIAVTALLHSEGSFSLLGWNSLLEPSSLFVIGIGVVSGALFWSTEKFIWRSLGSKS